MVGAVTFLLIIVTCTGNIVSNPFLDAIYGKISEFDFCPTFNNEVGFVGCSSSFHGDSGVLVVFRSVTQIVESLKDIIPGSYVALLDTSIVTDESLKHILLCKYIKGILIADLTGSNSKPSSGFSPASKQEKVYSNGKTHQWNPLGSGLLEKGFRLPIFRLTSNSSVSSIIQCYGDIKVYGKIDWKILNCGVKMTSHMFSANQSVFDCKRKEKNAFSFVNFCDVLVVNNIFATHHDLSKGIKDAILVSGQLDSKSLFYVGSSGSHSTATGLIVFLGVMETISSYYKAKGLQSLNLRPIIFSLFNGESFNRSGSKLASYYLKNGASFYEKGVNFSSKDVKTFIHFDQLGLIEGDNSSVFLHTTNSDNSFVKRMLLQTDNKTLEIKLSDLSKDNLSMIPPSPYDSFKSDGAEFDGVIVSDYNTEFKNKYFSSFFDDNDNLNVSFDDNNKLRNLDLRSKLVKLISTVSKEILIESGVNDHELAGLEEFNKIDEYFYCILKNANCSMFQDLLMTNKIKNKTILRDLNVVTSESLVLLFKRIMGKNFGTVKPSGDPCCSTKPSGKLYSFNVTKGCVCDASVFTTLISSTQQNDKNDAPSKIPIWTESVWDQLELEYFHRSTKLFEIKIASIGCVSAVATLVFGVYLPRIIRKLLL